MRKTTTFALTVISALFASGGYYYLALADQNSNPDPFQVIQSSAKPLTTVDSIQPVKKTPESPVTEKIENLPSEALTSVPFIIQAPFQKWDTLHEDTCEEASLLMVKYAREKRTFADLKAADQELIAMVGWEEKKGYKPSITLDKLNIVASDFKGMTTGRVEKNKSLEDIKREIAEGRPVIIGAAGQVLDNPNFSGEGPVYHMLVIIGYDKNGFITNDPGVSQGQNFRYSFQNIEDAWHDYDQGEDVLKGAKNYLVFD